MHLAYAQPKRLRTTLDEGKPGESVGDSGDPTLIWDLQLATITAVFCVLNVANDRCVIASQSIIRLVNFGQGAPLR